MLEKQEEINASLKSQRLLSITQHQEWEEVLEICQDEYQSCFEKLMKIKQGESGESFIGGMKSIENILTKIKADIKYGQDCRKKIYGRLQKQDEPLGLTR